MGEYAEDILNGDVDQHTGEWIGDGQGFPRNTPSNKRKAPIHECYNGIANYFQLHYKHLLPDIPHTKHGTWLRFHNYMIKKFLIHKGITPRSGNKFSAVFNNARMVQDNWKEFREYIKDSSVWDFKYENS